MFWSRTERERERERQQLWLIRRFCSAQRLFGVRSHRRVASNAVVFFFFLQSFQQNFLSLFFLFSLPGPPPPPSLHHFIKHLHHLHPPPVLVVRPCQRRHPALLFYLTALPGFFPLNFSLIDIVFFFTKRSCGGGDLGWQKQGREA